jgi:uncharacterized protein
MGKLMMTKQQARRFLLAHQGLLPPHARKGKAGILDFISRVGCIQFDPLNIVGHNPELVLQSRISGFRPGMLQELLYKDRKLLDGWDKQMSIYKVEDWPCYKRYREENLRWLGAEDKPAVGILPQVRQLIEEKGPVSSIDLEFDETVSWAWGPTRVSRAALESMYFWGELIIHHKVYTRRVYDFAWKHLSQELLSAPEPNPADEEFHDWYVHRRIGGIGLMWIKSGEAWLGASSIKSAERNRALSRLLEQGKLTEVQVEGVKAPFYMQSGSLPLWEQVRDSGELRLKASIIAPLDNLLWDRILVKDLFDFDYRWEVYKPVTERRYGYYVLPVLYGDRFIARFEPGRDKKQGAVIIKNWWWEPGVKPVKKIQTELLQCFRRFLAYLGTDKLQVEFDLSTCKGMDWLQDLL